MRNFSTPSPCFPLNNSGGVPHPQNCGVGRSLPSSLIARPCGPLPYGRAVQAPHAGSAPRFRGTGRLFSLLLLCLFTGLSSCGSDIADKQGDVALPAAPFGPLLQAETFDGTAYSTALGDLLKEITNPTDGKLDNEKAALYLTAVDAVISRQPDYSNNPALAYRAAEVARATGDFSKGIAYYDYVETSTQPFDQRPMALFMRAFTYDENVKDLEKARRDYEAFIAKYPDHDFADDAALLLKNLGRSEEDILREYEEKAGE